MGCSTILSSCSASSAYFPSAQAEQGRGWNNQNQSQPTPAFRADALACRQDYCNLGDLIPSLLVTRRKPQFHCSSSTKLKGDACLNFVLLCHVAPAGRVEEGVEPRSDDVPEDLGLDQLPVQEAVKALPEEVPLPVWRFVKIS